MIRALCALAVVLAGCAAAPPEPEPPPPGIPFMPLYMEEMRQPPPPTCEPEDLLELMLGCD